MDPVILRTIADIRQRVDPARRESKRIGLVPTMGALHRGHARLIEHARQESDVVVVSIFVNPLQFGPNEDYLRYPRPLSDDVALCGRLGVDIVFAPDTQEMYSGEQFAFVEVARLTEHLCGPHRLGHFKGVATVVLKLFNMVQPDRAYFGEKDYQQLVIIQRMVDDFNLPISIVGVPTVREADGLAVSSRNIYLNADQRKSAPALFRALEAARQMVKSGESETERVLRAARQILDREPLMRSEYLEIVDPVNLRPVSPVAGRVRIAAAVWVGETRLIDNVEA